MKKSNKIRKLLSELIKTTEGKDGSRLIGKDYILWRIIPMAKRCPACKDRVR